MSDTIVKFDKLKCAPDSTFWAKFAELKIDKFKLEDEIKIPLWGSFSLGPENQRLLLDYTSFNEDLKLTSHKDTVPCRGFMINTNTLEKFRQTNPQNFINTLGKELLLSIKNGSAIQEPWRLMMFIILSFSDLKKYRFHYWAAHPTPYNLPEMHFVQQQVCVTEEFTVPQVQSYEEGFLRLDAQSRCFFAVIIFKKSEALKVVSLAEGIEIGNSSDKESVVDIYFAFFDPCLHPSAPGWPLRNLLCLLFYQYPNNCFKKWMKFISVKGKNIKKSVIYTIKIKEQENQDVLRIKLLEENLVGWEANSRGKMGSNIVDLSDQMDPVRLSDRAINLNLKLMKWRLVPELDLDYIGNLRCLLLGAGPLGCSVARALLGWGINTITFVDNSKVSVSDTIEPSLFTFEDVKNQKSRAEAAKDALLKIHPKLNTEGVDLQIPMPGHVIGNNMIESTKTAVEKLQELYAKHDVVFLLLESREAHWLPTVMCAAHDKLAINVSLDLDSFTVQRHGTRNEASDEPIDSNSANPPGKDLGCYFCNDAVLHEDIKINCVENDKLYINRPDSSLIAAGYAVELLVSLTQHPDKAEVRATTEEDNDHSGKESTQTMGLLGGVPHTLFGSLHNHEIQKKIFPKFLSCTACSAPVISEYFRSGLNFILCACYTPSCLENPFELQESVKKYLIDQGERETASLQGFKSLDQMNLRTVDEKDNSQYRVPISERATNLNLDLMKSLIPALDLDYISNLRCLLLGAGTLGCAVAKSLLGWGIHNITFVDNSAVSLSNPVRQSLYTFEDAINKRSKVVAAKNALLKHDPNLNVEGVNLQIPMPGHVVGDSMLESTKQAVVKLQDLYAKHDVVFLLLDSREARWLPTVMCAAHNKIAINAALGFDSYTVLRHGTRNEVSNTSPQLTNINPLGKDLGCYFCNDVTQPGNSQADRTLDQQCTVSRPGLSFIASGLAVALLAAVTQHPDKADSRAMTHTLAETMGLLGDVPHSLRGSLWNHEMLNTVVQRFPSCTACSTPIISEYLRSGVDFVLNACNQPNYLENLSGLDKLLIPDLDEICCAIDTSEEDED